MKEFVMFVLSLAYFTYHNNVSAIQFCMNAKFHFYLQLSKSPACICHMSSLLIHLLNPFIETI